MLNNTRAKHLNIFADVIGVIVALSIFIPFLFSPIPTSPRIIGCVLLVLLIASFVIKNAVYKQVNDQNWAAQFWAMFLGGFAIAYFLFW